MSKTSPIQRLTVLKEWLQQMERESRGYKRQRKTFKRVDDDDEAPIKRDE
jgi:hypothetical protein